MASQRNTNIKIGRYLPDVPPPIPAFSWCGMLSPLLLAPMAIPALIALTASNNVLDMLPLAKVFTEWVQKVIPWIDMGAHANSTIFPQVALLSHSLTVALVLPLWVVCTAQTLIVYPQNIARRKSIGRLSLKQHAIVLLSPLVFIGCLYALVSLPGDPSFASGFTTHKRYGFATLSFLILYATTWCLGAQVANIRIFIDTYIKSGADNAD